MSTPSAGHRLLLVHYAEIGLKKGHRVSFERRLRDRLNEGLKNAGIEAGASNVGRRYVIRIPSADLVGRALDVVRRIPGVANVQPAYAVPSELDAIREAGAKALLDAPPGSFKVETRRSWKQFPLNSIDVSRAVAPACFDATSRKVDVHHPDVTVRVEVMKGTTYVSAGRVPGAGGLPVGSTTRLLSFLSGGIDSAVATWLMVRRGARVTAVHFHNRTHEGNAVLEKLEDTCGVLAWSAGRVPLLVVPFESCQRALVAAVPAEYRMILYRRAMFRIAAALAPGEKALGYVTGDSLGQVASQTAENLRTIHAVADLPVYAPLVGSDKTEIIDRARDIGTFDISIRPHDDCCSFLIAQHPATKSTPEEAERFEEAVDWESLVAEAVAGTERIVYLPDPAVLRA